MSSWSRFPPAKDEEDGSGSTGEDEGLLGKVTTPGPFVVLRDTEILGVTGTQNVSGEADSTCSIIAAEDIVVGEVVNLGCCGTCSLGLLDWGLSI